MHSFLPATCPTYPILPHPTKPSPTEKPKPKTKNQKRKWTTANYPTSFLTFLFPSSPPFFTISKYLWSIATTIPIVIGNLNFNDVSLRACMHKLPSHLTFCTLHLLTHTVGKDTLCTFTSYKVLFFVVVICQHTTHTTYNIRDRTGKQVGTLLGWAGR